LQADITRDITENLSWKLTGVQKNHGQRFHAEAEAYQLYLQGRF